MNWATRSGVARDWGMLLAASVAAYATIPLIRAPLVWARAHEMVFPIVAASFLAAAALTTWWLAAGKYQVRGLRSWFLLGTLGGIYLWLTLRSRYPEEALHLIEYGAVALLSWRVLGHYVEGLWRDAGAVALTGFLGWIDEFIQWLTPGRKYDWNDVVLNLLAGVLAIAGLAVVEGARRRIVGRHSRIGPSATPTDDDGGVASPSALARENGGHGQ